MNHIEDRTPGHRHRVREQMPYSSWCNNSLPIGPDNKFRRSAKLSDCCILKQSFDLQRLVISMFVGFFKGVRIHVETSIECAFRSDLMRFENVHYG